MAIGATSRSKDLEMVANTLLLVARSLPEGLELYDFGGGMTIAPCPDLGDPAGYLADHIFAVARIRKSAEDPIVVTCVRIDLQFVTARQIVEAIDKAIEHNKTQTKQMEIVA